MATLRRFRVEISCPRPPRPPHIEADHHADLIQRAIDRRWVPGCDSSIPITLGMNSRTARLTCELPAHSPATALDQAETLMCMFLRAASFRIPSPIGNQPARPRGPMRATVTELNASPAGKGIR